MDNSQGSRTALMTAYIRGYHALHDDPIIINDTIGHRLVPLPAREALEMHLAKTASQMAPERAAECIDDAAALRLGVQIMAGSILARARYIEDRLEQAIRDKYVTQYVILGAGLDTFALRRPDMADILQIFEIDHPASQENKRFALGLAGFDVPSNLHFIPIDFNLQNLSDALATSAYNRHLPSFFCWAGVTHYLPREAIYATLSDITKLSSPGSELIFDYWDQAAFDPARSSSRVKSLIESTRSIGEPIITGFDPAGLSQELAPLGWRVLADLGPETIRDKYHLEDIGYTTSQHVHFACIEVI
ncbi:MAG: class I SAM-dependent methyltransferase [Deltaproteobacteria bacterium]